MIEFLVTNLIVLIYCASVLGCCIVFFVKLYKEWSRGFDITLAEICKFSVLAVFPILNTMVLATEIHQLSEKITVVPGRKIK